MLLATLYIALCFRKIEFPSSLYCVCKPNISFSIIPWLFGELHSVLSSRETQFWQLFIFSSPRRIAYFSCLITVQFAYYKNFFSYLLQLTNYQMFLLAGKIISRKKNLKHVIISKSRTELILLIWMSFGHKKMYLRPLKLF